MVLLIGEKLDFLMKLTNTKNSTLGRALNFDPSYISRIRGGKRGMPRHQAFVDAAADFFAGKLAEPYQAKAAAEVICPGHSWPATRREAADQIACWLTRGDETQEEHPVARFLSGFARLDAPAVPVPREIPAPSVRDADVRFFYGGAGKRRAVETFLSDLCAEGCPQQLLLYSDEEMSWLYEDPGFARRWAALLGQLLAAGSHIRIIHTVSRGAAEMLEAIRQWMPLYMTGAIEPWYYPGSRDGVLRRTLFVSRGEAALISSSIRENAKDNLNILTRDKQAVAALEREFEDYLSLCTPLMEIYSPRDAERFRAALRRLAAEGGELFLARGFHAPEDAPEVGAGEAGYSVLCSGEIPENVRIAVSEKGVLVARADPPGSAFLIREEQMTAAFRSFYKRIAAQGRFVPSGLRHPDAFFLGPDEP